MKLGFVSYKVKSIIDRILPVVLPYLTVTDGEMRHLPRYDKTWNMALIHKNKGENEFLNQWMKRVTLNFRSKSLGAYEIENKAGIYYLTKRNHWKIYKELFKYSQEIIFALPLFVEMGRVYGMNHCFEKEEVTKFAAPEFFDKKSLTFMKLSSPVSKLAWRYLAKMYDVKGSLKEKPFDRFV